MFYIFKQALSYSKFIFVSGKLSSTTIKPNENTQLSFTVDNVSKRDGNETVQVYLRKLNDSDGPLKTLKAFKRINLKAGEKQDITIDLPASSFEFYDSNTKKMNVASGEYEVYYGNSSDAKDLKMTKVLIK